MGVGRAFWGGLLLGGGFGIIGVPKPGECGEIDEEFGAAIYRRQGLSYNSMASEGAKPAKVKQLQERLAIRLRHANAKMPKPNPDYINKGELKRVQVR